MIPKNLNMMHFANDDEDFDDLLEDKQEDSDDLISQESM
jgi:hypothetical protein